MLTALIVRMQTGLVALLVAMFAPVRAARGRMELTRPRLARGAEFIEVALYAAIIVTIAWVFRNALRDAFDAILQSIRNALNIG